MSALGEGNMRNPHPWERAISLTLSRLSHEYTNSQLQRNSSSVYSLPPFFVVGMNAEGLVFLVAVLLWQVNIRGGLQVGEA